MMQNAKELLILRHAKSSWSESDVSDHDRRLNRRGRGDAPQIGRFLQERQWIPDVVLCSSARRTRETVDAILAECDLAADQVEYLDDLYLGQPEAYVAHLRRLPEEARRALVVGHNPGLESLLYLLVGQSHTMPTAALARVRLAAADWRSLSLDQSSSLLSLRRPKDS